MPSPAGSPVYRVLGPLEAESGGLPVPLPAGRQRVLLATLLLRANRTVSIAELIEKLWDRSIPVDARGTVQKHIMRLRRTIGHGPIRTEQDGYRIEIGPGQLDLNQFGELVKQGTRAAEDDQPAVAAAAFGEALALWRGLPPLANVPSESLHRHEVPQLLERYVRTLERRIEADLLLGRHGELVGELMALVQEHPLRERYWVQLMRALYGTGRQGEALEACREVVRLLADELGIAPGAELRAVHQEILRGTPIEARPPVRQPVRQLPMAIPGFVGRQAEVARIGEILRPDARNGLPVVVVTGPAGVGKTTLAVHASTAAARQLAGELIAAHPEASLRQIARSTGLAPSTVLDVRNRLRSGQDPVPTGQRQPAARPSALDRAAAIQTLRADPSLRFSEAGRTLLRWIDAGPVGRPPAPRSSTSCPGTASTPSFPGPAERPSLAATRRGPRHAPRPTHPNRPLTRSEPAVAPLRAGS
jgi:DNA-binding SARP family transcriptional activator